MQLHQEPGRAAIFFLFVFHFLSLPLARLGDWSCGCVCRHKPVCVHTHTHTQVCGRTSMQEASEEGLSLPTDSGSDSVPTELALETFLV